jgi:hypothetical protein
MTGGLELADGPGQIMRLGHHSTLRLLSSRGSAQWAGVGQPTLIDTAFDWVLAGSFVVSTTRNSPES